MKDIIIVGAGGCGREVADLICDINAISPTWNILGFIDDNETVLEEKICDYGIIGSIKKWEVPKGQYYVMGIASPKIKETVAHYLEEKGAEFVSIIHPSARISKSSRYGKGLVAYSSAKLGSDVIIGDFVTLQSTIIGHDVIVGDYATVSSSCGVTGGVRVGTRSFIGDHAMIAPGITIDDDAYVGIGSVVIRNVPANTKVFGNPARSIGIC